MASDEFDPPYEDVFSPNYKIADDNIKMCLLTQKWDTVHQFTFPKRYVGGKFRRIQAYWFNDNYWLRYSKSSNGVYCGPCYLFAGDVKTTLITAPATDPSNIGKTIASHNKATVHKNSTEAADNFQKIMSGQKRDISACMSTAYNALVEKNRNILQAIVESIMLCGKQNLPLRGHKEDHGNFVALLEFQAKHNPLFQDHLTNGDPKTKYTSNIIQNELINICGDEIKKNIVHNCNSSPFFGFIADEATDVSRIEQMSICLRYYDKTLQNVTRVATEIQK